MSHKVYFWSIGLAILGTWSALIAFVRMTTPTDTLSPLLIGFFSTLFLALWSTMTGAMTVFWCRRGRCVRNHHRLLRALRHGTLLALWILACTVLQWYGFLLWWTALLVGGAVVLYELRVILIAQKF